MYFTKKPKSRSLQFWVLAGYLGVVFLTGGSSRSDPQSLLILGPLSFLVAAFGLLTLAKPHLENCKWTIWAGSFIAIFFLAQLAPLPPKIWHDLPSREVLIDIDRLANLDGLWRPLAISPANAMHALLSLVTPLAVVLIGIQLDKNDIYSLLPVVICFGIVSGFLGVLQVIGETQGILYLYSTTNIDVAVGLFANRNHAAVLLVCLFPMIFVLIYSSYWSLQRVRTAKFASSSVIVLLVILILVTGSRAGLILMVMTLLVSTLFLSWSRVDTGKVDEQIGFGRKARLAIVVALTAGLTLLTVLFSRAEAVVRLIERTGVEDGRADFWQLGVQLIWKYLPFGAGIGSFADVYELAEPDNFATGLYTNHLHNDWLEFSLVLGLPAIAFLMSAVFAYSWRIVSVWKCKNVNGDEMLFFRLASILLAILAASSFVDYPTRTPIMMSLSVIFVLWFTRGSSKSIKGRNFSHCGNDPIP